MCEFCKELEAWKKKLEKKKYEYGCMLYACQKNKPGSITSSPFELNYCPVCGKKIAGE
nr:MAG TPA: MqsA [Caudoviricetes sp.]DAH67885.1 MAG TPA: MqsA [Caudoviricetes sp.]DAU86168.1 MAG TPA: MqsA [Caudoviricetes sp.]